MEPRSHKFCLDLIKSTFKVELLAFLSSLTFKQPFSFIILAPAHFHRTALEYTINPFNFLWLNIDFVSFLQQKSKNNREIKGLCAAPSVHVCARQTIASGALEGDTWEASQL